MSENKQRDRVKDHLDAARDWLGSASGALENREDVKSELDLMLAEAELTRAREMKNSPAGDAVLRSKSKLVRQFLRAAPLLAALVVAAVWLRFTAVTIPVKPVPPTPPVVEKPAAPQVTKLKADKPAAASDNKPADGGYAAGQPAADGKESAVGSAPAPGVVPEGKQPPEAVSRNDDAGPEPAPEARAGSLTPDAATQQMMLDAAKMLRRTK